VDIHLHFHGHDPVAPTRGLSLEILDHQPSTSGHGLAELDHLSDRPDSSLRDRRGPAGKCRRKLVEPSGHASPPRASEWGQGGRRLLAWRQDSQQVGGNSGDPVDRLLHRLSGTDRWLLHSADFAHVLSGGGGDFL